MPAMLCNRDVTKTNSETQKKEGGGESGRENDARCLVTPTTVISFREQQRRHLKKGKSESRKRRQNKL